MAGPYFNTGVFSTRITDNDTVGPKEELGVWRYEAGKVLRYVKSGSLIPAYESVRLDHSVTTAALMGNQVVQTDGATNVFMGVAEVTFANLSFGWITVYGPATARVAGPQADGTTSARDGAPLGPSGNTGVLSIRNTSHFNAVAVAVQSGLSAGSAIFIRML